MNNRIVALCLCLFSCGALLAQEMSADLEKTAIAVNDLTGEGVDPSASRLISERLRTELFRTGKFRVIERGQMEEILREQGFQQSGCTSDACAVELGQILGVRQIVAGTVGQIGQLYTINVRLIDVSTGQIVQSVNTDCRCAIEDVLVRSTPDIARQLAGEPAAAPAATSPVAEQEGLARAAQAAQSTTVSPALSSRGSIWPKLLFAVVAVGGGSAGMVMNRMAAEKVDEADRLYDEALVSPLRRDQLAVQYRSVYDEARSFARLRTIGYGLAALGVVGFGVSFAF